MKKCCWILLVMFHMARLDAAAQPRKIIIDCDPGIDDAMAIILALQYSGFEIVGVTTVFGNAYLEQATRNALTVVELSGRPIPVYQGAAKPLNIKLTPPPDFVHGKDGLGNTNQPAPTTAPHSKSAAQFIADAARASPGQITILAVGRLTNLAEAMKLDANLTRNVREVVLMGGAVNFPGNVSPVAEANISGDPDAADVVLTAPWKVTMIALNTTTKVKLNDEILMRIPKQQQQVWVVCLCDHEVLRGLSQERRSCRGRLLRPRSIGSHVPDRSQHLHRETRARQSRPRRHRDWANHHACLRVSVGDGAMARPASCDHCQ